MANQLPPELRDTAARQAGIVTSDQAATAGLSRNAIRARVRAGRWQRLHRGVYATFSGEPGRPAVLWAAVLWAGPGALFSHQTAAELIGLTDTPRELLHVTIPIDRHLARARGIVIHRSARARAALHPARLPPQTRIEETVLDLVNGASTIDDAVGWVTRALGHRLTTQARLRAALALRPRLRWRRELTELLSPDLAGLMSVLERRYERGVERPHGLPRGARQIRVQRGERIEYRDVLYEEYGTCVELDGKLAHPAEARWRDIRRDNAVAADGGVTLRYGWLDVTTQACKTAAEVDRTLRQRGFTGGRPCGPGCPLGRGPTDQSPSGRRRVVPVAKRRPSRPASRSPAGPGRGRGATTTAARGPTAPSAVQSPAD